MNKIKKLEKLLGIKLQPYEYGEREKNSYKINKQFNKIHELYLNEVHLENFDNIIDISGLTIKDSTVNSLSELLKLKKLYRLTLENVIFEDFGNKTILNETLLNITIKNVNFNAVNLINCIGIKFASFSNCKIDNSYALSKLPNLYQLDFNNCKLEKLESNSKNTSNSRNLQWLDISNMTFENIQSFLCFQKTKSIRLTNCNVKSISDLYLFKELESFHIDSNTNIEYTDKTTYRHSSIYCEILQSEQVINFKNIFPIIHYIDKLHLENLKVDRLELIENFINVKHLSFEKSDVYLDSFLDLSSNIETLRLQDSTLKKTKYLDKFTKLKTIETNSGEGGIDSLKELLPLKNQLKTLISFDDELKDLGIINNFQQLELLQINGAESKALGQILSLEQLKHLYLYVDFDDDEEITINLKNLKSIDRLNFSNYNVTYKGFEHLKELKALRVAYDFQKINPFPKMEKLERLQFKGEGEITISSKEFPNLRELKIEGDAIIALDVPSLEILECPYIKDFSEVTEMPNLKKLCIKETDKLSDVLHKVPNLTHLQIKDFKRTNLDVFTVLRKLEYFDFSNEYLDSNENIIDIKALNSFPNLKEANISGLEKLESQLNNPEIAVYFRMPYIHFHIYKEDDLWI